MNTRMVLTFVTVLILTGAVPPFQSDTVLAASAQPEATACSRAECIRECQRAGGTLDECNAACRDASNLPGRRTRPDRFCVQECTATGQSRAVCEARCSTTEPTAPSKPDFPAPTRPRPGN